MAGEDSNPDTVSNVDESTVLESRLEISSIVVLRRRLRRGMLLPLVLAPGVVGTGVDDSCRSDEGEGEAEASLGGGPTGEGEAEASLGGSSTGEGLGRLDFPLPLPLPTTVVLAGSCLVADLVLGRLWLTGAELALGGRLDVCLASRLVLGTASCPALSRILVCCGDKVSWAKGYWQMSSWLT